MTHEPRLFIAVPLDEPARTEVASIVAEVRAAVGDGRGLRWVRLDGLHLTLRFLGPTPESRLGDLAATIRAAAAQTRPFRLTFADAGAFPPVGRPRTVWLGVGEGAAALGGLAARVAAELATRGWPPDDRPFRAHLTLARTDGARQGPAAVAELGRAFDGHAVASDVDRLVVYESVTGGGPARYVPHAEALLG